MNQVLLERQIRPIYDALDTGSNKSALQTCNKVLKKYPTLDIVKALKALAIVRMSKVEESLPLCDEVLASKPTDLETLGIMMHVLRALGRHADLVTMYDEAYRKQPANEELGIQDFFANVRTGNWKNAQQISLRLHKNFKHDRYLYWSVLCTHLQAKDLATAPPMRSILHKLAHRILNTSKPTSETPDPAAKDAEGSSEQSGSAEAQETATVNQVHSSPDKLHVALSVLRSVELFDEAAALLETTSGKAMARTNLTLDEVRRAIVTERGTEAIREESKRAMEKIQEGDRNWLEFLAVLEATLPATVDSEKATPDAESIERAREFFQGLAEKDGRKDRAPLLGLLELEKRARSHKVGVSEVDSKENLPSLAILYFERFGDKACCFEDLRPYISTLEGDEMVRWISHLDGQDHNSNSFSTLQRSINVHKLRRHTLTPEDLTPEKEEERVFAYLREYTASLALGKDLPETELQPADDLVILAAQAMIGLWKSSGDLRWLYMAAVVLEYATKRSKYSYYIRLHLIRIYRILGCPSLSLNYYQEMNVKQVQTDTLSHFILAHASNFSCGGAGDLTWITACVDSSYIYGANSTDTSEYIIAAFRQETYSQIPDIIAFEEQLENSLERDLVEVEHVRMRLPHEVITQDLIDTELVKLKFVFDRYHHDNRDFDILPNYQPRGSSTINEQTLLFGTSPGTGWLFSFLRIYIRVLQMASDLCDTIEEKLLIGDRPKIIETPENKLPLQERLSTRKEEELKELTADEMLLYNFSMALCEWLAPYHDHARPPPAVVLAEASKQTELLKSGKAGKVLPQNGGNGSATVASNGHKKGSEEPPAVKEPPELVVKFFDDMAKRFQSVSDGHDRCSDILHIVAVTQEAATLVALSAHRFKSSAVVRSNKFGLLTQGLKTIRTNASAVLKDMSEKIAKIGVDENTMERRKVMVDACSPISNIPEFDHDFIVTTMRGITDSRKKVLEGFGKGLAKVGNHL
ncbi:actin cytoskeleton organization protein [Schizopora paradoxa]|uniref:Actin cytoskeleton organization protein n=1 Tax=Schizopora paradoxa TaxID=27342 RepID=A0A0H2R089_9AGAM|nr:actin cytoskeleton organization protein [Schizopora paradoxa]